MQRIAKVTGKYWHDEEGTKLCVHPSFGTWTAFRALVVFNTSQGDESKTPIIPNVPPMCQCPVKSQEIKNAKRVMDYALKSYNNETNIDLDESLRILLDHAVTKASEWSKVPQTKRPWIQLRNCISVGSRDFKYSDNQLLYHYTNDTGILKMELKNFD